MLHSKINFSFFFFKIILKSKKYLPFVSKIFKNLEITWRIMNSKRKEELLKISALGDLKSIKENFDSLIKEDIESIKDLHKARLISYLIFDF